MNADSEAVLMVKDEMGQAPAALPPAESVGVLLISSGLVNEAGQPTLLNWIPLSSLKTLLVMFFSFFLAERNLFYPFLRNLRESCFSHEPGQTEPV